MKNLISIQSLHRDIESHVEKVPKFVFLNQTVMQDDYIKYIVLTLANNIKDHVEDIIKTNLIYAYMLTKDFNYSYRIIDTKIANTRFTVKRKSTVKFCVGTYDPTSEFCIQQMINLIIKSKNEILNSKDDDKTRFKLVNDIITISVLLGDLLDINIDFKDKDFKFNNMFHIEVELGKTTLNNFDV